MTAAFSLCKANVISTSEDALLLPSAISIHHFHLLTDLHSPTWKTRNSDLALFVKDTGLYRLHGNKELLQRGTPTLLLRQASHSNSLHDAVPTDDQLASQ